jgi:hypothetical protein
MGFCFGNEQESHFGLIFARYETCCHNENSTAIIPQCNVTFSCKCNDINIEPIIVSQVPSSISESLQGLEVLSFGNIYRIINKLSFFKSEKVVQYYRKAPPNLLSKNSQIVKNSIILQI